MISHKQYFLVARRSYKKLFSLEKLVAVFSKKKWMFFRVVLNKMYEKYFILPLINIHPAPSDFFLVLSCQ